MTTTSSRSGLAAWRTRLRSHDQCPWPGPRPLTADDPASLLVGREDDARRFRQVVEQHRLVILDGESGVGKTSLLQASLIPALADVGFAVAGIRDWTDDEATDNPVSFLAAKVKRAFRAGRGRSASGAAAWDRVADFPGGSRFFAALDDPSAPTAVIVLDQFEELLRYSERRAKEIIETIVVLNHHFRIKVVVSLRSEYLHKLRSLEREAKPYTLSTFALEPVADSWARALVEAGNSDGRAVDDDAAATIARLWSEAREDEGAAGAGGGLAGEIGLLHLQAFLYALHASDEVPPISADDVARFTESLGAGSPKELFVAAMSRAVNVKLQRCVLSAQGLADPYLIAGARHVTARMTRHLSSGGFKLHREVGDLLGQTLEDEITSLQTGIARLAGVGEAEVAEGIQDLITALVTAAKSPGEGHRDDGAQTSEAALDLIADPWWVLAGHTALGGASSRLARWLAVTGEEVSSEGATATCGPLMGMSPVIVLIEECRRFALALAWMEHSSLVRLSTPVPATTVVSLIHDRFGEGLATWGGDAAESPFAALTAITAPNGASFDWKADDRTHAELTGAEGHRVIANLRWRGGWVSADFRDVVFTNCDLRGTMFSRCGFRGVAFVNCLLDGCIFSDCTIEGRPKDPEADWSAEPSRFRVPVAASDRDWVAAIPGYRRLESAGEDLFSPVAGLPALPWPERERRDPDGELTAWTPSHGGLTVAGGRVSSLVLRGTTFETAGGADGMISFRHVAGSGLDVVEQRDAGRIGVHASAIRHVTVTRPVEPGPAEADDSPGGDRRYGRVEVVITGCAAAQLWFGDGLEGSATITGSRVLHVWNASPGFAVSIGEESGYHGLIDCVVDPETSGPLGGQERSFVVEFDQIDPEGVMRERGRAMNYSRDPARSFGPPSMGPESQGGGA